MHMNSAPHLLAEDRPEFERVLDHALRTANHDPELATAIGQRLNTEQLRTMALSAMAAISACATAEYENFVTVREELRARSSAPGDGDGGSDDTPSPAMAGPEDPGAGAGAVVAVLAPVLAGIAAFLFLLIGYVMRLVGAGEGAADSMITVGWWFGGFTVAGVLVAMAGMLLTALRNGPHPEEAPPADLLAAEADRAREAWRQALLERGVRPFLREALANGSGPPRSSYAARHQEGPGRTPQLGYSRPGFSSPDNRADTSNRPRYTSPDYTSPDFGNTDHRSE
ncbi:hypothetical protein BLA24_17695 [Streptomyces cinnamoneus]|uniref:Transmembrane protein n=1 Tax=Streptomyces cinnamoneus TaxID=53446 RepID=A0A2G1XHC4_STRCJ|nr:hypothetical protein [Streptomyces cinnamoneus]PHQ50630.1 hypothetical protein BLA24_17695 [Streptomyces cinnamoneus]PPT14115.1 hypothetical protein CYQ11_15580 [Streptomyces cinnamoneus]